MQKSKFDFDQIIDRSCTSSVKYGRRKEVFGTEDILPMWVADMDFKSPPAVIEAAENLCKTGVFGYAFRPLAAIDAFIKWVDKNYNWVVKKEWISATPGIVAALPIAVRVYTSPGDKVLIQTPVYPPFHTAIRDNERTVVSSPLRLEGDNWLIDWNDFEEKLKSDVKLFILCSSHNPIGKIWSFEELEKMGNLCLKYGVTIFSDEIHADLALYGNKHIPIANVSEEISKITVTAMAPSKTFNIAGMLNSVIISSSENLMAKFNKEIWALHLDLGNIFAHNTMEVAYKSGEEWLKELKCYLEKNINYVDTFLKRHLPFIKMVKPQSSFLLWLDFRESGYTHEQVGERLIKLSKLGLNDGAEFGTEGIGFRRMNIAAPLSIVKEGMERLKIGFSKGDTV